VSGPYQFRSGRQAGAMSPTKVAELAIAGFVRWACLEAGWARRGAIGDPAVPSTGASPALLAPSFDPRVAAGRTWEGRRADWVWESGLQEQPALDPTVTVSVNGTVQDPSTYVVDYPQGRVTFAAPVAATAEVAATRWECLVRVETDPAFLLHLDPNSLADADPRRGAASGDLAVAPARRLQLPAVVVTHAFDWTARPYELGGARLLAAQRFDLTVAAETPWDRAWLHDALVAQVDRTVPSFDPALVPPPLDRNGTPRPGACPYPVACEQFPAPPLLVIAAASADADARGDLFSVRVRWTVETVL
jgi:hypothetical protein